MLRYPRIMPRRLAFLSVVNAPKAILRTVYSTMTASWTPLRALLPPNQYPAAQALVAAIDSPPSSDVGRKRILISSDWVQPTEIFDLVAKERPELASRLSPRVKDFPFEVKRVIDNKRLKEVLGLEVTPWRKTILDSVDAVIKMEDEWKKRGLVPSYL